MGIKRTNLTTRVTGSAALDLAYVGAGRFDGYFQENLNLWDIAAGIVIIKEAGGKINDIDTKKMKGLDVIASNVAIHSQITNKIK